MPITIEERVASQEKAYRSMVTSLVENVWVIDPEKWVFLYISPEAYETRGYSQKEVIGMDVKKILTSNSVATIKKHYEYAKSDIEKDLFKSYKMELRVIRKNNTKAWIEVTSKPARDVDGKIKLVGISRDISEKKKSEIEKEELLNELQDALTEKNRLLKQIRKLERLLPICSSCRRIRDNKDKKWWPFEKYIEVKSESKFSHTLCPDCQEVLYSKDK